MSKVGRRIEIRGTVQGVGFRPWVYQSAQRAAVAGRVWNDSHGVTIEAFGDDASIEEFTLSLGRNLPPAARVREIEWRALPFEDLATFSIVESGRGGERNVSIPPDLATCGDCLEEVFDPSNRRYLYPFTNCTNCGPRYTIVRDSPYDREKTTMASFTMCRECRAEYEDPLNRRFHAQPNACPSCGPRLSAATPFGRKISTDEAIGFAARALRAQLTVAVKGLGGFHLACDATSPLAVRRMRQRKHREAKPLAVMVRDLAEAEAIAVMSEAERELLASVERPIVLLRKREDATVRIAEEVTGANPLIGLFLPYTPLHHILLRECGVPLVMTSGNATDEPMCTTNADALEHLRDVADVFLMHDRHIATRADDSVVRVIDGAPTILRRARGYVPRRIDLSRAFSEPVLAVGAHLKNAICIGAGTGAFLGPHVGDLETFETMRSFERSVDQMKQFIGIEPRVVAHDLHPDYFSTRYALGIPDVRHVGVQHHHAHVVAGMAEHGLTGHAIGVAYDGTGFGTDGTSWGGEILLASFTGFERIATFRALPLAGGDQAIRQVWRIALAALDEAFDGEPPLQSLPLFSTMERSLVDPVRQMIAKSVNAPLARGVGRYFDAVGAIGLAMPEARYEGEVALLWNMAADASEHGRYEVVIRDGVSPWEIDLRPTIRGAALDIIGGVPASTVSARFHNTLIETTVEVVRAAGVLHGSAPVVLSGGCFQNALLSEGVASRLRPRQEVFLNHDVPPGDGGLALGQAVIADAVARSEHAETEAMKEMPACV